MKKLSSIVVVLLIGTMTLPSLAQSRPHVAIAVTDIIEALEGSVSKANEAGFSWNPVDTSAYTEFVEGPVAPGPDIELTGVSYLYIPFAEPVAYLELREILDNSARFEGSSPLPRDLPEDLLPLGLSAPGTGVWVVLGQLSQPMSDSWCDEHHGRLYVTVSNPGGTAFEANENRPGAYFDGGDVFYGSQMGCDGVSNFMDVMNDSGGAGAFPGFAPFFYDGGNIVGTVIPDQLFGVDALARTTWEERPPIGEDTDATNTRANTDSPVGVPLLEVALLDQWPECAVELGFTSEAEGEAEEPAEDAGSGDEQPTATTQGITPISEEESASAGDDGSGLPWFLWAGVVGAIVALSVYLWMRKADSGTDFKQPLPEADNPNVLAWLSPTEAFEPSGGIRNQTATNIEVEQVGSDILQNDLADEQAVDSHFAQQAPAPDEQDLLEAKYLLGIFGFGDFTVRSDAVLAADIDTSVKEILLAIPPDNLCERLREQCNRAKAELERHRQILNQKEAALARAEAEQSKLDKELQTLNEFLKGGGDSFESEGDSEEEIDLRLKERYIDQRRSSYEADLAAAGDDRDARSNASQRFDEDTKNAHRAEARAQRRKQASQTRDEVAEDAAIAKKITETAKDERNLARHSVEKGGEYVARICAEADKCDGEIEDAAALEEEIKKKLREERAKEDAKWEKRKKAGFPDYEEDARPLPEPPVPPPPPKAGSLGPTPGKPDSPEMPRYIASLGCTVGDEILNFVSSTSNVIYTDPSEDLTIKFVDARTPALEEWLRRNGVPPTYNITTKELSGPRSTRSVLALSGGKAKDLVKGGSEEGNDSLLAVANMSIRVELTVRTATFACAEVWKCNQAGEYEFEGYRCQRVMGSESPPETRKDEFTIHGLNVGMLFLDVQRWIRKFVPENQQFCRNCKSGHLRR